MKFSSFLESVGCHSFNTVLYVFVLINNWIAKSMKRFDKFSSKIIIKQQTIFNIEELISVVVKVNHNKMV